MDSEAGIIIAFLFKRSGKTELKESDIYLPLSIELGWFSSQQAHDFVKRALKQKLLIKKGGLITPNFDVEKINIPVGFYPSGTSFEPGDRIVTEEKQEDILDMIVRFIVEKTGQDERSIIAKIREIESEKSVLPEVAALVVAKEYGVDAEDFFERVENILFRGNGE